MDFKIFTDGGSFKNEKEETGYDGAAAFIIWEDGNKIAEEGIFLKGKTNNFSEMFAIGKSITVLREYIEKHVEDKTNITVAGSNPNSFCVIIETPLTPPYTKLFGSMKILNAKESINIPNSNCVYLLI